MDADKRALVLDHSPFELGLRAANSVQDSFDRRPGVRHRLLRVKPRNRHRAESQDPITKRPIGGVEVVDHRLLLLLAVNLPTERFKLLFRGTRGGGGNGLPGVGLEVRQHVEVLALGIELCLRLRVALDTGLEASTNATHLLKIEISGPANERPAGTARAPDGVDCCHVRMLEERRQLVPLLAKEGLLVLDFPATIPLRFLVAHNRAFEPLAHQADPVQIRIRSILNEPSPITGTIPGISDRGIVHLLDERRELGTSGDELTLLALRGLGDFGGLASLLGAIILGGLALGLQLRIASDLRRVVNGGTVHRDHLAAIDDGPTDDLHPIQDEDLAAVFRRRGPAHVAVGLEGESVLDAGGTRSEVSCVAGHAVLRGLSGGAGAVWRKNSLHESPLNHLFNRFS